MSNKSNVFLYVPNIIGYLRILLLFIFVLLAQSSSTLAVLSYITSASLDIVDGIVARRLDQCSHFGAMLDMIVDRCTTACLCGAIIIQFPHLGMLFVLWTVLDFASHWFHQHSCIVNGINSHKDESTFSHPILKTYYGNKRIMAPLAIGAEVFLLSVYLLAFTEGSIHHSILVTGTMALPLFVAKIVVNLIQLKEAARRLVRSQIRTSSSSLMLDKID